MSRMTIVGRMGLLWLVTLPWGARKLFPVNSFSANWTSKNSNHANNTATARAKVENESKKKDVKLLKLGTEIGEKNLSSINRIFQVKKWQYVFYKHVILHGLNISMAFPKGGDDTLAFSNDNIPLPITTEWRIFWLALNTSYVMEFFLQSLVKRGVMSQRWMMIMNVLLMTSSSLAAVGAVFGRVRVEAVVLSLLLNFGNRGHDIFNTMLVGCYSIYNT